MDNELSSRDLKRIESDRRILEAATYVMGKKGYSASSIREIANKAEVTPGLIIQRFNTKENLTVQALYLTNIVWKDLDPTVEVSAYDILMHIIGDAKNMYDNNPDGFDFLYMMCSSTVLPDAVIDIQRKVFYEKGLYGALKKAQDEGYLPDGDLAVLYNIFKCNALRLIRDYKNAGLELPKDETFLNLIQYKDPVAKEHQFYRDKAFESVYQSFFSLTYFNINTGEYRIATTIKAIERIAEKHTNGQEFLNHVCDELVSTNDQSRIKEFLDLSTVLERIDDKKVIYADYFGIDNYRCRISFIYVVKEPGNEIVLCGAQRINEDI